MTCHEKIAHRSLRSAAQAVVEQLEAHGRSQRIYRCPECDSFHLTSDCDQLSPEQVAQIKELAR